MTPGELIAEFRRAKANGDPAKYVHVISVAQAHATASTLEAQQAEIDRLREAIQDAIGEIEVGAPFTAQDNLKAALSHPIGEGQK